MNATAGRALGRGGGGALDFGRSRSGRTEPRGSVRAARVSGFSSFSALGGDGGSMLRRFCEPDRDCEGEMLFFEAIDAQETAWRMGEMERTRLEPTATVALAVLGLRVDSGTFRGDPRAGRYVHAVLDL
jgi:hypothetical protein